MKEVRIKDKVFVESLSPRVIADRVKELASELSALYRDRNPLLVSVLNGAFIFTADLIRALDFDAEVTFVRVSSYEGGMSSTGKVRELVGVQADLTGRDVLVVEDIVDTGHTLEWMRKTLNEKGARSVKMATLLFKEEAYQYAQPPEFIGFSIPNEFVVGYGLDYDQHGRSLDAVYKLKV